VGRKANATKYRVNKRQQESARRRQARCELTQQMATAIARCAAATGTRQTRLQTGNLQMQIVWDDPVVWRCANGREIPISEMDNEHLWRTINWAVLNREALWSVFRHPPRTTHELGPAVAAATWLREQPLFRRLVQEAIQRQFTFTQQVFAYLHVYVIAEADLKLASEPWRDERQDFQQKDLEPFLDQPVIKRSAEEARSLRGLIL